MLRTGRVSDPDALITLLEEFAAEPRKVAELTDEQRRRLMIAAGQLSRPDRYTRKALRKGLNRKAELATKAADRAILDGTGIRALRKLPIFTSLGAIPALPPGEQIDDPAVTDDAPDGGAWAEAEARRDDDAAPRRVARARNCYVCKADFHDLHWFYDQMCPACADENWAKRNQSADLRGRVALVTGGRVKIGAQIAQKLLRAGAEVIVVTRFPVDAARRLAAEPDGDELATRAHVFGCDLRHTPSVEALCAHVRAGWSRLDVLINNACQTVRRPSGFYDHLLAGEAVAPSEVGPRERAMLARWWGEHPGPATALPDGGGARWSPAAANRPACGGPRSCRRCRSSGPPAARPARPEQLALHAGRGAHGGAARGAAGERHRALRAQRAAQAADDAHAHARQAHRQRVGHGGAVLPPSRPTSTRTPTWPRPRST
jgi:hypothetical protein